MDLFGEFSLRKHMGQKTGCIAGLSVDACCFMLASSLKGQAVMLRWVLFALLVGICSSAGEPKKKQAKPQSLARGWGDGISWVKSYEEGLQKMVKSKKPLMVIHHQDGCQFSQELKKAFVGEKSIQKMAKEGFIMLNLLNETEDKNLAPDGHYTPRILFVDPSMTVRTDITGKYGNRLYTYEPGDMEHLAKNMKKAQILLKTEL